jgi:hypothetical protein
MIKIMDESKVSPTGGDLEGPDTMTNDQINDKKPF